MKNFLLRILFLLSLGHLAVVIGTSSSALAQNLLSYPIPDLGSCRDAKECYLYCEIPVNKAACWSYGAYKLNPNVLGVITISDQEQVEMEKKAKQYGITFPIKELGNCTTVAACKNFCEQPANYQSCTDFARKKGFAKEVERTDQDTGIPEDKRQEIMANARTELGCTSMDTCRTICEQDHTKCEAFAKKHGLSKEPPKALQMQEQQRKEQILKVAQQDLGCTSMESCKSICEKNPEFCMQFAKKHGFDQPNEQRDEPPRRLLGEPSRGPSVRPPCASEESCKRYCVEHPDECPGFQGKPSLAPELRPPTEGSFGKPSTDFVGPTGCRTEAECKAFCQTNPEKCPGFKDTQEKLPSLQSQPSTRNAYPSSVPSQPGTEDYREPTPYRYPGAGGGGYPKPTGSQYNYYPPAYPTNTQPPFVAPITSPSQGSGYQNMPPQYPTSTVSSPQPLPTP